MCEWGLYFQAGFIKGNVSRYHLLAIKITIFFYWEKRINKLVSMRILCDYSRVMRNKHKLISIPVDSSLHQRIHNISKDKGIPVRVLMRKGIDLMISDIECGNIEVNTAVERPTL